MKFRVDTVSGYHGGTEKSKLEAMGLKFEEPSEAGEDWAFVQLYSEGEAEITSIAELMQFIAEWGRVIIYPAEGSDLRPLLRIYKDWVE